MTHAEAMAAMETIAEQAVFKGTAATGDYGFPMLVSCYLLVRMESKTDKLSANIDALTHVIAGAK